MPTIVAQIGSPSAANRAFSDRVQAILNRESHRADFDLADLAARLQMSRAQLYRALGQACGQTPSELIIRFRLERAARMLQQRSGNVGEVAYAVGFRDLSHFVKRFRQQYGQTPAAYALARRA